MFFKNFFINLQTEIYSWNNIMRRLALKTEKKTRKVFFFFFFRCISLQFIIRLVVEYFTLSAVARINIWFYYKN